MYCVTIAVITGGMLSAVRQLSQLFTKLSEIDCRATRGRGTYYTISCLNLSAGFALLLVSIFVGESYLVRQAPREALKPLRAGCYVERTWRIPTGKSAHFWYAGVTSPSLTP